MATKSADTKRATVAITGRLSFPHLFTAQSVNGGEPRYSANILLDKQKDKGQIATLRATIKQLIEDNFEKNLPASKVCLRDGEEKDFDGYENAWYVSAANKKRPQVINRDTSALSEEDGVIYAGCYVKAVITLWVQDNQYGKRVNAALEAIQFVKDGEPFGGRADVGNFLSNLEEDEVDDEDI